MAQTTQTTNKLFPSQEQEEKIFLIIRKHWFNYVIFFFVDFLLLIPIMALLIYVANNPGFLGTDWGAITIIVLSILVLTMLGAQLYGFVSYYLDIYIVTDQRIVDINQNGLFSRDISELHLHQVQDVNAKVDSFWGTLLHFGDVYIQTAGERENFVFKSIPNPYTVSKQIIDLHEENLEAFAAEPDEDFVEDYQDSGRPEVKTVPPVEVSDNSIPPDKEVETLSTPPKDNIEAVNDIQQDNPTPQSGSMDEGQEIKF